MPLPLNEVPELPERPRALRRVAATIGALAVALVLVAWVCIDILSATRAYVAGESRWSQAQKTATVALLNYARTGDEVHWRHYRSAMAVPLGDRMAREALALPQPDHAVARNGFLQGRNHPDDIDGMIWLYRGFRRLPLLAASIEVWAEADGLVTELDGLAHGLRADVQAGADAAQRRTWIERVLALDERLTPLEQRFSDNLGEAARQTRLLLLVGLGLTASVLTAGAALGMRRALQRERVQAEQLRHSQAQRERAIRGSSDGFWEWDLKRRSAYFSPRFEALLGLEVGTLAQDIQAARDRQHPDDQVQAKRALKLHLRTGAPYDVLLRMRHRDGSWRWMRSRASCDRGADGSELRLAGSIQDVTEQRLAEEALRRREAMFRSLWETTTDAVLMIDLRHDIRFANPAAHQLFGHAPGTLPGQPLAVLQPERLRHGHRVGADRYVASGQRRLDWRSTEILARHAQGHDMPMEISFSELELDGERLFVGFLRDISERQRAQRALQEANEGLEARVAERTAELRQANERLRELDRLKSEFMAMVSHELRTPLNSILGFTEILRRGSSGALNERQQRQVNHVHDSGQHLLSLINDVLDLTSIESGRMDLNPTALDFAELAAEVQAQLQPLADQKGLALTLQLGPDLRLSADRRKLYQVLLNLVGNGIKFTRQGEVRIEAEASDGRLHVRVRDTGLGIDAGGINQLFQAFHQLDRALDRGHAGTGLGLHLCRKLLTLMGGEIGVDSTPGEGSCFRFELPLAP